MRAQILTLLTLLFLVSCGAQKTATTLQVSSGFALAANNNAFNGGLIISGKMVGSDKAFSYAIPRNTGAGNQVTIELPKGQWNFYAAGWKYTSGGDRYFTNDVYCGTTSANLSANEASVDLQISPTNCDSSTFASNRNNSGNPAGIKIFHLSSCMSFFDHSVPAWITSTTSATYCDGASMPVDMRSKVNSFKIYAPNRTLNNQFSNGFSSGCIPRTSNSSVIDPALDLRLPTNNIPFVVEIFEDSNCSKNIATYPMHEGMEFDYPGFDKMILPKSGDISLHLPSGQFRRGKSPFYALLPEFRCSGSFCADNSNTYEFMLNTSLDMTVTVEHDTSLSCSDFTVSLPTNTLVNTSYNYGTGAGAVGYRCDDAGDEIRYTFRNVNACSGPCYTIPGTYELTFTLTRGGNTKTYDVYAANSTGGAKLGMMDRAWRSTGANSRPEWGGTNNGGKRDEDKYGFLSNVRNMLGPDGVGGVFSDISSCSSATGTRTISVRDEGQWKTYQATISNTSGYNFDLFASTTNPYNSPSISFEKKITVSELVSPGSYELRHVIAINCSTKTGKMHEVHEELENNGNTRHERKIIHWNTQTSSQARAEEYAYEISVTPSSTLVDYNARVNRIYKGTSDDYYYVNGMEFRFHRNGGLFDESFDRYFYYGNSSSDIIGGEVFADSVNGQSFASRGTLGVFGRSAAPQTAGIYNYDRNSYSGTPTQIINTSNFSTNSGITYSEPSWTSSHPNPVEYSVNNFDATTLDMGDFDSLLNGDAFFAP